MVISTTNTSFLSPFYLAFVSLSLSLSLPLCLPLSLSPSLPLSSLFLSFPYTYLTCEIVDGVVVGAAGAGTAHVGVTVVAGTGVMLLLYCCCLADALI